VVLDEQEASELLSRFVAAIEYRDLIDRTEQAFMQWKANLSDQNATSQLRQEVVPMVKALANFANMLKKVSPTVDVV
jgi:hypothetical protein